jgi:predicted AAA+ superfamily ATPase
MIYKRLIKLNNILRSKSHFLFGPRQVGKSTTIEQQLPEAYVIDLLDSDRFDTFLRRPKALGEELEQSQARIVVIDEIQKLPALLDEVQRLLKRDRWVFLLTGSSARKLKRRGTNLLGGRVWTKHLFPLVYTEIDDFDLMRYLNNGGLPSVYLSHQPEKELKAYCQTYLKHEIQDEALVRNLRAFSTFLDLMGKTNGCELNFTALAQDCGVSDQTIRSYIEILEDTLIAYRLPAFTLSKKRMAHKRSKFYFFDTGVAKTLARHEGLNKDHPAYGIYFEQFIMNEVRAFLSYSDQEVECAYWRSLSGFEVDLLIGRSLAVEIKATDLVREKHLKGLLALAEEGIFDRYIVVSQDTQKRSIGAIEIWPWELFLQSLWRGDWSFHG